MRLLATARFADTVVRLHQLARANRDGLPEVAFVGRSNAGKSTCINLICNRRRLAFSSRTPGRTQALNLFALGPDTPGSRPIGFLVDTPGYGFAAAAPEAKRSWQALAGDYLRGRAALVGVVLMLDIRRELTDLDRQLLGWTPSTLPLVVVLTKADKLSRPQARAALERVAADPALSGRDAPTLLLLFSMMSRIGVEPLQAAIEALLTADAGDWDRLADRADPAQPTLRRQQFAPPTDPAPLEPAR
ncbi:MAG: ribosome biogenesis GTP-binding protein YihA/YsxC [Lautropia sp.]